MGLAQLLAILKTQKLDLCTCLAQLMFFETITVACLNYKIFRANVIHTQIVINAASIVLRYFIALE